jgi:hypothetical protein
MKKLITLFASVIALVFMLYPFITFTNSSQAPTGATGAPGDFGTCALAGCHMGSAVITSGNFIILESQGPNNLNTAGYLPDTTYNLSLNVANINKPRYGFSITALDANNNPAGTFSLISTANTAINTQNGRTYVSHKNANSTAAWIFKWKAPSTNVGVIKFYIAANGANNNNDKTGDQIYTTVYSVTTTQGLTREGGASGIQPLNADENGISVFPNPLGNRITLSFNVSDNKHIFAGLYNFNGQLIQQFIDDYHTAGYYNNTFSLVSDIPTGLYLIQIKMNDTVFFKKVMVN